MADPLFALDEVPTVTIVDDLQAEGDAQLGRILLRCLADGQARTARELEADVKDWSTRTRTRRVLDQLTVAGHVARTTHTHDDPYRYRIVHTPGEA